MDTKEKGRSAQEMAKHLLIGTNLSDWQVDFLAIALEESANYGAIVSDKDCLNELVQMNSSHRQSILGVAYAMTGLSFKCSINRCVYGSRLSLLLFVLDEFERCNPMSRDSFDAMSDAHGWGSDAHRIALGALVVAD
jgi:hypothetical protein